jgi:hypothetical protein
VEGGYLLNRDSQVLNVSMRKFTKRCLGGGGGGGYLLNRDFQVLNVEEVRLAGCLDESGRVLAGKPMNSLIKFESIGTNYDCGLAKNI